MEPTIKNINSTSTLLHPATFLGQTHTAVTINSLIFRPVLKKIVFTTVEFGRIIVYEGDSLFTAHLGDSNDTLIGVLLSTIDSKYKA